MAILVFQTAYLGDLLLSIPLLKNLNRLYPSAEIHLVCRKGFGDLMMSLGLVSKVIEVDKKNPREKNRFLSQMRGWEYEFIISPHESFRTASWLRQVSCRGSRVSFHRWFNGPVYDQRVQKPDHLPDALRQLSLLASIHPGFAEEFSQWVDRYQSHFRVTRQTADFRNLEAIPETMNLEVPLKAGDSLYPHLDHFIALAPGSVWATKKWRISHAKILAEKLIARGDTLVLFGGKNEVADCESIASVSPKIVNLCGLTNLIQLRELLARAKVLIANDSGAAHMASTVGIPIRSVFGPTVLDQGFRPWTNDLVVFQKPLGCRPCGRHGGEKCPIGTHECMKSVTPEEVFSSL